MDEKEWGFYEDHSKSLFNRIVYSDDEEFYEHESRPLRTILIKKININAYILVYNTSTGQFKRYIVPHYKRRDADIQIKPIDDETDSTDDFRTSKDFNECYLVKA